MPSPYLGYWGSSIASAWYGLPDDYGAECKAHEQDTWHCDRDLHIDLALAELHAELYGAMASPSPSPMYSPMADWWAMPSPSPFFFDDYFNFGEDFNPFDPSTNWEDIDWSDLFISAS